MLALAHIRPTAVYSSCNSNASGNSLCWYYFSFGNDKLLGIVSNSVLIRTHRAACPGVDR